MAAAPEATAAKTAPEIEKQPQSAASTPALPVAETNPLAGPSIRRAGDLVVEEPPRKRPDSTYGRLRNHIIGGLSKGTTRYWAGVSVPEYVLLAIDTRELFLLDPVDGGHLALYRDPYNAASCTLEGAANCSYIARFYDLQGTNRWSLEFASLWSRPDYLEIQDIRLVDGILYFNEACQSYSETVGGKCSSLVAVDPAQARILWRTKHLVSNHRFLVVGDFIVAGYGFTDEPDFLYLIRRRDGQVLNRKRVPTAPMDIATLPDGRIAVQLYNGQQRIVTITRGKRPRLRFAP